MPWANNLIVLPECDFDAYGDGPFRFPRGTNGLVRK